MRNYAPRGSVRPVHRVRRRVDIKRLSIFSAVVVGIIICVVLCIKNFTRPEEIEALEPTTGVQNINNVFNDGVSIGGINVSGMTLQQAKSAIETVAQNATANDVIEFTVNIPQEKSASITTESNAQTTEASKKYTLSGDEIGITIDIDGSLTDALAAQGNTTSQQKAFPLKRTLNTSIAKAKLNAFAESDGWVIEPINAKYKPAHYSSEENLTTWGEMVASEPQDGYKVNTDDLLAQIEAQAKNGLFTPFEAKIETVQADGSTDTREPVLLASATTSFDSSPEERRYNVWKISDKLNGVTFKPGVEFSVNNYVGDRNAENGWKQANGIENGIYTPQYGGGICQVSSTMYNAALKAGMDIVSRVPHTIMAAYVKPGLDATISTGGPDFKVENPYDSNLYMIVNCSVPDRKVTVEIWGYEERDYNVELYSELMSDKEEKLPAPEFKVNPNLGLYEINEVRPGRRFEKYQLYKRKLDKNTGKVLEDGIKIGTSTYNEIVGVYEVGTGVPITPGMTIEEAKAAADAAAKAAEINPPAQINPLDPGVTVVPNQDTDFVPANPDNSTEFTTPYVAET